MGDETKTERDDNMLPKSNEVYRHFKGNLYKIVTLAKHSETGEDMVVYRALYGDSQVYVRPLEMFLSKVDKEKYPDSTQEYRFERVEEETEQIQEVDPLIMEFLESETYAEKRNILAALQHRITDEMISTMAVAMDIVIEEGDTQKRYQQLKNCIDMKERFEINRP